MNYEYNGNLIEDDRINLVANEIIDKYPFISFDKAKSSAMLEGKISTKKNTEIEFNRLYNIMLVIHDDKHNVKTVYEDLIKLLSNSEDDNNDYYTIALEIANYLKGEREFPYLDEF